MHVPTYGVSRTTTFPKRNRKLPWWAAAIFFGITSLIGWVSTGNTKKTRKLYNKELRQAPWAPPGWVFGPAWSIINIFLIRALLQLVNEKYKDRQDKQLIVLQAGIWLIFCSFGYVYFRKKSPWLAAIWTQTDFILALASLFIAKGKSRNLAVNYYPLLGWTTYASSLAWYQAIKNDDPVLEVDAID